MRLRVKILILIIILVLVGLGFLSWLSPRIYAVPVLMYHSVNLMPKEGNRLQISQDTFDRQMRFLKEKKYNVVTLEEVARIILSGKSVPHKTVVITLDDGYRDNYYFAFPILKKYGLPATIFIIYNEIGRFDRLSWNEVYTMRDSGLITFGSHTLGPEPLVNIKSDDEVRRQIFLSKVKFQEKVGKPVDLFSYPEGKFNSRIKDLVKEAGYKAAVVTSPGKKYPNNDIFLLKRLRISSTAENLLVFWIQTSGFYTFIKEHRDKD